MRALLLQSLITSRGTPSKLKGAKEALGGLVDQIAPSLCRLTSCSIDCLRGGAFGFFLPLVVGGKYAEGLTVEGQTFDSIN